MIRSRRAATLLYLECTRQHECLLRPGDGYIEKTALLVDVFGLGAGVLLAPLPMAASLYGVARTAGLADLGRRVDLVERSVRRGEGEPELVEALRRDAEGGRGRMGDTWYLHELFVTIQGRQQYLWRAVDEDGDEIDILVQSRRNRRAAIRFFRKVLKGQGREPRRLVTDKLRSYPAAYQTVLPSVVHRRFGREPLNPHDAHRPLRDDEDLDVIFTWQEERKLSRNLTFQYKRVIYLVAPGPETLPLAGVRWRVHEHDDGRVEVRHAGHALPTGSSSIRSPVSSNAPSWPTSGSAPC